MACPPYESESRRLGALPDPPLSPPRSVCAVVVAAWVICWRRCRRLAHAGCCCGDDAVAGSDAVAPAPDPPSAAGPFQPARKGAAMRCPTVEAREPAPRPAACAPVLATLPRPAAAP